jgi:hypothetical protein
MAIAVRWSPIAFAIFAPHRKRNNVLNVPTFSNIYFTSTDVADPAMFSEQGHPLFR